MIYRVIIATLLVVVSVNAIENTAHESKKPKLPFLHLLRAMSRSKTDVLKTVYKSCSYSISQKSKEFRHRYLDGDEDDSVVVTTYIQPVLAGHKTAPYDQSSQLQKIIQMIDDKQNERINEIITTEKALDPSKQKYFSKDKDNVLIWDDFVRIDSSTRCKILLTQHPCALCETKVSVDKDMNGPSSVWRENFVRDQGIRENQLEALNKKMVKNNPYILHEAAKIGNDEMLENALKNGANPNQRVKSYMLRENATPLMIAAFSGRTKCVKMLQQHGAIDTDNEALNCSLSWNPKLKVLKLLIDTQEKMILAHKMLQKNHRIPEQEKQKIVNGLKEYESRVPLS